MAPRPAADPLIHVGYVKTGSSWLQRYLFTTGGAAGGAGLRQVGDRGAITRAMHWPTDLTFDPDRWRQVVEPDLAAVRREGGVPVITHEILSGNPFGGGWNAASMARRLRAAHPDARVLVVVREQVAHIGSVYREYVAGGGAASFAHLTEPKRTHQLPTWDFAFWEYDRLVALYLELFGPSSVLVLTHEQLDRDPEGFCDAVCAFAGAPPLRPVPRQRVRSAARDASTLVRRWANRGLYRDSLNPAAPAYRPDLARRLGRVPLPDALHRRVGDRLDAAVAARVAEEVPDGYAAANARLAALTGLDLAGYGYRT